MRGAGMYSAIITLLISACACQQLPTAYHATRYTVGDLRLQVSSVDVGRPSAGDNGLSKWRAAVGGAMALLLGSYSSQVLWDDVVGAENVAPLQLGRDPVPPMRPGSKARQVQPLLEQVVQCVNEKYAPRNTVWDAVMSDDQLGEFKAVGAWWKNIRTPPSATLVTSASVSRLPQLYAQCISWSGPMSAVLYLALPSDGSGKLSPSNQGSLRSAVLQIVQFLADMQHMPNACQPDIMLVYEMYADDAARSLLYPYNILRNLARLQARTPLVLMLDVDLVPSRSLSDRLRNKAHAADMVQQAQYNTTVFIVPAFDARGPQSARAAWADALSTTSKDMLVEAWSRHVVVPFQIEAYPQGHNMTNFPQWKNSSEDYFVQHSWGSEPWLVGDRVSLPWHDDRYRGYGLDKVQFIKDVATRKLNFKVMHDTFAIHRAHKKGDARNIFIRGKLSTLGKIGTVQDPSMYLHNAGLMGQQEALARQGINWQPLLHPATLNCLEALPWWRRSRHKLTVNRQKKVVKE